MTALGPQVHTLPLPDTVSYYSLPLTTQHTGAVELLPSHTVRERGRGREEERE